MKKLFVMLLVCTMLVSFGGCAAEEPDTIRKSKKDEPQLESFTATILEFSNNSVLVQPVEGEDELRSSDQISFGTKDLEELPVAAGSRVVIYYDGLIMETYPARINAQRWELAADTPLNNYEGPWLDEETAEKIDDSYYAEDLIISEIYADCFIAYPLIPMPYTLKLSGSISEKWCVGDQVVCTYENARIDKNSRIEADLLTIETGTFEIDPEACYKPVIYLYPQEETEVSVKLLLDGQLTCTYPAYSDGWQVTAAPDGTLTDKQGQTYNYLYWEGTVNTQWDMTEGFCVKGEDTAAFLEESLEKLGLTRKEANEFIVYWLPLMEQNPYNIISFQTATYTDAAQLDITPAPDTVIRVFMTWQASDYSIRLLPQKLTAPEREGFTVVEWGGTEAH